MPQRQHADPLVTRAGQRLYELRSEQGYTLEGLTQGAALRGKGFVSQVENGKALPPLTTLDRLAQALNCDIVDLVNFVERGMRNQLLERTRGMDDDQIKRLLALAERLDGRPRPAVPKPSMSGRLEPGRPRTMLEPRPRRIKRKPRNTTRRRKSQPGR